MEVNFDKKEYERIMEDIEMQLKDIKIQLEKSDKKQRIIIHKKTNRLENNNDEDLGFISEPDLNQKIIVKSITAGINDDNQILINDSTNGEQNHCYYYTTRQTIIKERSKFRRFLNKVANKILE